MNQGLIEAVLVFIPLYSFFLGFRNGLIKTFGVFLSYVLGLILSLTLSIPVLDIFGLGQSNLAIVTVFFRIFTISSRLLKLVANALNSIFIQ